ELFGERVAEPHDNASLELPDDERRVHRLAHVVHRYHAKDFDLTGLAVERDLQRLRAEAPAALLPVVDERRRRDDVLPLAAAVAKNRFDGRGFGAAAAVYLLLPERQRRRFFVENLPRDLEQLRARIGGRAQHGHAARYEHAARIGAVIERDRGGVGARDADVADLDTELFGGNLRDCRLHAAADVRRADEHLDAAVALD